MAQQRHPKVPTQPPRQLRNTPADIYVVRPVLWRIHRTTGEHVAPWYQLRDWGPAPSMRFDPHPEPPGVHPGVGVLYAATDVAIAAAEFFQAARTIDPTSGRPRLTSWTPIRPLRLLDLTGDWALRNGAAYALASAPRSTCRRWAGAIRTTWPDLDGLWTASTMTARPNVVLFDHARDTFPPSPAFSEYLAQSDIWAVMREIAHRYHYRLLM